MNVFKSYFVPKKAASKAKAGKEKATVVTETKPNNGARQGAPVSGPASLRGSRPDSIRSSALFPVGDFRNDLDSVNDVRAEVVCNYMYQQQLERGYTTGVLPGEGVVLKKRKNDYTCCPADLRQHQYGLYDMSMELNVRCAITVNTRVINIIMAARRVARDYIPLPGGLRLQVLRSMRDLPRCQKHHFAAFIEDTQMLVVWDDNPKNIFTRAANLEKQLMQMIWGTDEGEEDESEQDEKGVPALQENGVDELDLEATALEPKRKTQLTSPVMVAITLILCFLCLGTGLRAIALEIATDNNYVRLALAAVIPVQLFVSLFFFQSIVGNFFEIFGPIGSVRQNSKHYSGEAPRRKLDREVQALPHVTVQMPVYKEGLNAVIKPTIASLKQCISTYELQGGSANIFVNDDGMQLIPEEDKNARREFYDEHNIGWVSRPAHNPNPEDGSRPFLRRGKFKKASNMNYALMISNRIEEKLKQFQRTPEWTQAHEQEAYEQCLQQVLEEDEGRTQAEGNIRVGDYILIIDSDTRVPSDCLLDAVTEMEQSPEVAIMQFSSGVMRVTTSYFEAGVTWFTNLIYTAISFAVANGDAPPFVGHNAILRWSAIQDAASYEDEDGYEKYWSESHVSEDFDMSLRMQCAGYILRFATYTGEGFKEGVSLTVYDELARWEKYAYGCNELIFHPLKYWLFKGPITPLFRRFLFSSIHLPKKLTICAYIGTYYAIGAAWLLTVGNYFLTGWYFGQYDKFYLDSFAIYISIIVVFTGFGNVALAILRYRLGDQPLIWAFWDNLRWIPLISIFLGGISLHVSQAILSHFFSINMTWGATAKELERVNFVEELPRLLRRFKGTFVFCLGAAALMICGVYAFPPQWRISYFASIWPLANIVVCHFLLPVALNPALMVFAW
ncbi:hypothetical protein DL771_000249 [Monosporascus sp. 5C6A]|nr:hypothetical protein DL771_000249 [Monosporascus sp. 5C6A]